MNIEQAKHLPVACPVCRVVVDSWYIAEHPCCKKLLQDMAVMMAPKYHLTRPRVRTLEAENIK